MNTEEDLQESFQDDWHNGTKEPTKSDIHSRDERGALSGSISRIALVSALWAVAVFGFLGWSLWTTRQENEKVADRMARAYFNTDYVFRSWVASHGGVYMPTNERTGPNPHLEQVAERDITTPSGKRLTLLNAAYALGQMQQEHSQLLGIKARITSLKHSRSETAPDEWEKAALAEFEGGLKEKRDFVEMRGEPYLRLMSPLMTNNSCLKCHGIQGYKAGDVHGGISVSVPMKPFLEAERHQFWVQVLSHGAIFLIGLSAVFVGIQRLDRREGERDVALAALSKTRHELEDHVRERTAELVAANEELKREVAERMRAEEAVRESEERFRRFADEAAFEGILIHEPGAILDVNKRFAEMFGYERSELIGTDSVNLVEPAQRKPMAKNWRERIMDLYDSVGLRKDGSTFPMEIKPSEIPYHGRLVRAAAVRDVTERKLAERALRQSEERYRTLFDQSADAIFVTSPDGEIIAANSACSKLIGAPGEEIVGALIHEFYLDPTDRETFRRAMNSKGFLRQAEWNLKRKDGGKRICVASSSLWTDAEGTVLGYLSIVRDITESRRLEEQLLQSQKLEAVGTLASGIAHDFNNLLQIVLGYADMLLLGRNCQGRDRERIRAIRQAARDGGNLVKGLLTFTREVGINPRPIDLNQEVNRVRGLLSRTIPKMIEIELCLAEDLKTVNADPGQMEQVLLNLAINARDAMPTGGRLTIETENVILIEEYPETHLEVEPGEYVLLTVSDTGSGMEPKVLEHIFEPFFTTKEPDKGTGLGLARVFGIVKSHEGQITCYSEPGTGTTFKIYLPVLGVSTGPDAAATTDMPAVGTETILLVDDEDKIRDLGEEMLGMAGYKVLTARNGNEALELYRKKQADISLVILDLIMPEMGGRECLEKLLEFNPNVRVLVASGYSANGPTKEALHAGAKGFISKPFESHELLRIIRKVLDED